MTVTTLPLPLRRVTLDGLRARLADARERRALDLALTLGDHRVQHDVMVAHRRAAA